MAPGAVFARQRSFIYPVAGSDSRARDVPVGFREVDLRTSDGIALRSAYRPARGRPTIVFFHGNGDSVSGADVATYALGQAGYGVLLLEYRGYGGNAGSPSEAGLYRDGRAALDWLAAQGVAAANVVLIGNSLGSGVATELATERRVRGLVIVSGFTSLPDVAAAHLWWAPVRWLMQDRYDNLSKIRTIDVPILVLHGTGDALIPEAHGPELARAARHATFVAVPGVGHELAYLPRSQAAIADWLTRTASPTR